MKRVSKYKEVAEYWAKHNRSVYNKAKQANPTMTDLKKETVKHYFVDNVEAYMEEDGLSAGEAIDKTLRGREFKSVADFYAEGVIENLKENYAKEIGWTGSRFRNQKGQFASNKFKELRYDGEVIIEDVQYKVYRMPNADGVMMYYYETGSPKGGTFSTFINTKRYY